MKIEVVVTRSAPGCVQVRADAGAGCGRCQEPGGCGGVQFAALFGHRDISLNLAVSDPLPTGAAACLEVRGLGRWRALWLAYLRPLACLLLGSFGASLVGGEPAAALGGLIGLLLGFWGLRAAVPLAGARLVPRKEGGE